MTDPKAQRFTWLHLLVILFIVVFVIGLLLPTVHRGEIAYKIKCASNLRQIGLAIRMYANGEARTGAFPRTRFDRATANHPVVFTGATATNPFAADGPAPNDVTAALFLILRTQDITTDVFNCPIIIEAGRSERLTLAAGKTIKDFSNFASEKNLNYSMQNPYPTEAAEKAGFEWSDKLSADFAIMADTNPGIRELLSVGYESAPREQRRINSPNNFPDGQNVLYADGHVDWSASPWAGCGQDNIYGFNSPSTFVAQTPPAAAPLPSTPPVPIGIIGPPADGNDSVLLPTADQKAP